MINQDLLLCDSWQDKEHPEMDAKDQDDLEDDFGLNRLSEVKGPVHHHGPKLDQNHDQEGSWHLILRQRRSDVCRRVFLQNKTLNINTSFLDPCR